MMLTIATLYQRVWHLMMMVSRLSYLRKKRLNDREIGRSRDIINFLKSYSVKTHL